MFAYVVLCCLLVNFIDCSVVRHQSKVTQYLETNDSDFDNPLENGYPRLGRSYPRLERDVLMKRSERAAPAPPAVVGTATENPKKVAVTIENRHGIRVGTCPTGYVKRGGFCFPDVDY